MAWAYDPSKHTIYNTSNPSEFIQVEQMEKLLQATGVPLDLIAMFFETLAISVSGKPRQFVVDWVKQAIDQIARNPTTNIQILIEEYIRNNHPFVSAQWMSQQAKKAPTAQQAKQAQQTAYKANVGQAQRKAWTNIDYDRFLDDAWAQKTKQPKPPPKPPKPKSYRVKLLTRCGCSKELDMPELPEKIEIILMGDTGFLKDQMTGLDNIEAKDFEIRVFRFSHKKSIVLMTDEEISEIYGIEPYGVVSITELLPAKGVEVRRRPNSMDIEILLPTYVEECPTKGKK